MEQISLTAEGMEGFVKVLVEKIEQAISARTEQGVGIANQTQVAERLLNAVEDFSQRLERLERQLNNGIEREAYTTEPVAERLRRTSWTVRQWCNLGLVPGAKKVPGKDRKGEWRIPHEVLVRLEREGPLPLRKQLAS